MLRYKVSAASNSLKAPPRSASVSTNPSGLVLFPPRFKAAGDMAGKEESQIFVGGLSWCTTERTVEGAFRRFGKIVHVQVLYCPYLCGLRCFICAIGRYTWVICMFRCKSAIAFPISGSSLAEPCSIHR